MRKFLYHNGLSIVFLLMFVVGLFGQVIFGISQYNDELLKAGASTVSMSGYLTSGHFMQSTFENLESEFLQMALFVWLTIFLRQKGSSESKGFDGPEEVDRKPSPSKIDAPWPVKKGGIWLSLYKDSLTVSLLLLFLLSFVIHFCGSRNDENLFRSLRGESVLTFSDYMTDSRFWFESFQNWQSEFLSVFAIVVLSIYLRQQGSPQSKPVDAPNSETG